MTDAAEAADAALARLAVELDRAREHVRRGTALTVSGDAPAPELTSAADLLAGASDEADAARRGLLALQGIAAAIQPAVTVPFLSFGGTDLELIAGQLQSSAAAAALFVQRRDATQAVVDALAEALAALERDDPTGALASLEAAGAPLGLLEDWEERPPLLDYWLMISGDLLDAAHDIAIATLNDDPAAVKAAGERYAAAAELARGADNAVALTLSEEGAAISATPLRRLAAVADEADEARSGLVPALPEAS